MRAMISASVMCADLMALRPHLLELEALDIDLLHVDVMDGVFVPNYALGTDFIRQLRAATSIPLDIHLMVSHPEDKLSYFQLAPGDTVSIHVEATPTPQRALAALRALGARPMAALCPDTPLAALDHVLPDIDGVLAMAVHPGFAGQAAVPHAIERIAALRARLDDRGYATLPIAVDGNVSFANAPRMRSAGADVFVVGSSSMYAKGDTVQCNLERLRGSLA